MSPGEAAYREDVRRRPLYHDGTHRHTWAELCPATKWNWERYPTAREWAERDVQA